MGLDTGVDQGRGDVVGAVAGGLGGGDQGGVVGDQTRSRIYISFIVSQGMRKETIEASAYIQEMETKTLADGCRGREELSRHRDGLRTATPPQMSNLRPQAGRWAHSVRQFSIANFYPNDMLRWGQVQRQLCSNRHSFGFAQ